MDRRISPSDLTGARLVPDATINVFRVDKNTVVKVCDPNRLAEAEALRFVRTKTSLPVPELYSADVDESIGRGMIVMEYIEGEVLRDVINDMDLERRQKIISQLQAYMSEVRSVKGDFTGSVDGSPCEDPVFCADQGAFGPYKTETEFNDGLIRAMEIPGENSWVTHVSKLIRAMSYHEIVLTHADFSPRNIIIRGDQVVGILDWEMAGFYPAYWEYIKALYHPNWQSRWIKDGLISSAGYFYQVCFRSFKVTRYHGRVRIPFLVFFFHLCAPSQFQAPQEPKMPRKGYPAPLVVQPLGAEHTHTIIALHGRGSNAERFGRELLASADLKTRLPTVKFVFPTASKRRSTILKKIPINQWYDNYSLENPGERTDLQIDGLNETAEFIRGLIDAEAQLLNDKKAKNIILLGLSQGCAAAIFALLGGWADSSRETPIGAFVGMSGWLPFEEELRQILQCDEKLVSVEDGHQKPQSRGLEQPVSDNPDDSDDGVDTDSDSFDEGAEADVYSDEGSDEEDPFTQETRQDDDFDPFEEEKEKDGTPLSIKAINHIRDILELPLIAIGEQLSAENQSPVELSHISTPVFVGYGAEDPKVSSALGKGMSNLLSAGLGMNVIWREYKGLGHWYRVEDEVEDILAFLQHEVGLKARPLSCIGK
ncbi:unnamed protein product [Penicillium olsonii]|nr:unnamed protein product [Penicillium olsonii]